MAICHSAGCVEGGHSNWGECVRSKAVQLNGIESINGVDRTKQKKWDYELDSYREARDGGLQPRSTNLKDSRAAMEAAS